MTHDELRDGLDGIFAYDSGAVSSGVRDEALRQRIINHMQSLPADEHRRLLARLTVEMWLSDDALDQGYGPEDAREFLDWCDDQGFLLST